jgi:hypothetical protein
MQNSEGNKTSQGPQTMEIWFFTVHTLHNKKMRRHNILLNKHELCDSSGESLKKSGEK